MGYIEIKINTLILSEHTFILGLNTPNQFVLIKNSANIIIFIMEILSEPQYIQPICID